MESRINSLDLPMLGFLIGVGAGIAVVVLVVWLAKKYGVVFPDLH